MIDIAVKAILDKLPVAELEDSLHTYLKPMMAVLPDKRLEQVVPLAVCGIIGSKTPVITHMAQSVARTESGVWAAAKRVYRFLSNDRFNHQELGMVCMLYLGRMFKPKSHPIPWLLLIRSILKNRMSMSWKG